MNLSEGYSLRPPAATNRVREHIASRTVTWTAFDKATGSTVWMLLATRGSWHIAEDSLQTYAEQTADALRKRKGTVVESCQLVTAAGRKGFDLRTTDTDVGTVFQRMVCVVISPGQVFSLGIRGPEGNRRELLAIHQAVLDSVELPDAKALLAQREANLSAGKELLAALTPAKLAGALEKEDEWVLMTVDGQAVGFCLVRERVAALKGRPGIEVKSWLMLEQPGQSTVTTTGVLRASADRTAETVAITREFGASGSSSRETLTLAKFGGTISCTRSGSSKSPPPAEMVLAETMNDRYLPMALASVLSRLVDLREPRSYAFALYNPIANALDVCTFTVVGPTTAPLPDGRKVPAIQATLLQAEDANPQVLWLDSSGKVLGQFDEQMSAQRSSRKEVLDRFPRARELLEQIDADAAESASQPIATQGNK